MSITEIDRIVAAYERVCKLGTVPRNRLLEVVATSLGISVEMVEEALNLESQS
jgi:hypothetical protein